MRIPVEAKAVHGILSGTSIKFLDFAERHPETFSSKPFTALEDRGVFGRYPLQGWPTFVNRKTRQDMYNASVGLYNVFKKIPERIFGNDPLRLAKFYGENREHASILTELSKDTHYMDGLLGRGDFILTRSGFKCLEFNTSGTLGGWESADWAQRLETVPIFQKFIAEHPIRFHCPDTGRIFLEHVIEQARKQGLFADELNLVLATPKSTRIRRPLEDYMNRLLVEILREDYGGRRGGVSFHAFDELEQKDYKINVNGKRVHAILDQRLYEDDQEVDRHLQLVVCQMTGNVNVYNGPISGILADKRNLALLSQSCDSPIFRPEEQAIIRAHVPWTRDVRRGYTDYQGQPVPMDGLLASERRNLVLKHGMSSVGAGVHIGRGLSAAQWDELVRGALQQEGTYLVQERIESVPLMYPCGEGMADFHDVIWGLFIFGKTYGGGFLRMLPQGREVPINAAQGATEGIILEVDETEETGLR